MPLQRFEFHACTYDGRTITFPVYAESEDEARSKFDPDSAARAYLAMRPHNSFNPLHTHGRYVLISHPYANEDVIQQAKDSLLFEMRELIPESSRRKVTWTVDSERKFYDPTAGLYILRTLVEWRYEP